MIVYCWPIKAFLCLLFRSKHSFIHNNINQKSFIGSQKTMRVVTKFLLFAATLVTSIHWDCSREGGFSKSLSSLCHYTTPNTYQSLLEQNFPKVISRIETYGGHRVAKVYDVLGSKIQQTLKGGKELVNDNVAVYMRDTRIMDYVRTKDMEHFLKEELKEFFKMVSEFLSNIINSIKSVVDKIYQSVMSNVHDIENRITFFFKDSILKYIALYYIPIKAFLDIQLELLIPFWAKTVANTIMNVMHFIWSFKYVTDFFIVLLEKTISILYGLFASRYPDIASELEPLWDILFTLNRKIQRFLSALFQELMKGINSELYFKTAVDYERGVVESNKKNTYSGELDLVEEYGINDVDETIYVTSTLINTITAGSELLAILTKKSSSNNIKLTTKDLHEEFQAWHKTIENKAKNVLSAFEKEVEEYQQEKIQEILPKFKNYLQDFSNRSNNYFRNINNVILDINCTAGLEPETNSTIWLDKNGKQLKKYISRRQMREYFSEAKTGLSNITDYVHSQVRETLDTVTNHVKTIQEQHLEVYGVWENVMITECSKRMAYIDLLDHNIETEKQRNQNWRQFLQLKKLLFKTRVLLTEYPIKLTELEDFLKDVESTLSLFSHENGEYLYTLRSKANLSFQEREKREKPEHELDQLSISENYEFANQLSNVENSLNNIILTQKFIESPLNPDEEFPLKLNFSTNSNNFNKIISDDILHRDIDEVLSF